MNDKEHTLEAKEILKKVGLINNNRPIIPYSSILKNR